MEGMRLMEEREENNSFQFSGDNSLREARPATALAGD